MSKRTSDHQTRKSIDANVKVTVHLASLAPPKPNLHPKFQVQRQLAVPAQPPTVMPSVEAASANDDNNRSRQAESRRDRPFYLRRQRFHGFRHVSQLPARGSLTHLNYEDRVLLKKRLLQHRLQEMIERLESEKPEKITGQLEAKINYLKELATRP